MKHLKLAISIVVYLLVLLCSCSSNHITITYEIGDICITRQMYSRYSVLSYSSNTCPDAGYIIIQEPKGEYQAMLAIDTCQNIIFVANSNACTELSPKHIDTTVWQVRTLNAHNWLDKYEESEVVYLDYVLRREIYANSGFANTRKSRENTHWRCYYPNLSKWNLSDFGYIGGLYQPTTIFPNSNDSIVVLQFMENELENPQYISLSRYKHDCSKDIINRGCTGCQLFHVYYDCQNKKGEMILVKDTTNNIIDHLNIVLQSNDTIQQANEAVIYKSLSRVNSREFYTSVSVETTNIRTDLPFDTVVTRTQYDLIDGHYRSHPVKDIYVYE